MIQEGKCHFCGVPCVRVLYLLQVGIFKDGYELVLERGVNHPALVVYEPLLLLLSEEALLLPGRLPCWYGCRSSQIGWADKESARDSSIFLR